MSILPWWAKALIAAALLAAASWAAHIYNESLREDGRIEVRAEWTADREKQTAAALAESETNRAIETERSRLAAKAQQRKDDEVQAVNARLAADLASLRNRPERPAVGGAVAVNPTTPTACTGAELYRPDAEFLVREAARAQRILAERDFCHDRYDALTVKQ